jgi:hypothetical protein
MAREDQVRQAVDEVRKELELVTSPLDACAILLLALSNRGEPDASGFPEFLQAGVGPALGRYLKEPQLGETLARLAAVSAAALSEKPAVRDDSTVEVSVGAADTRIMVLSTNGATARALRLTQGDHVDVTHVETERLFTMSVRAFAPRIVLVELDHFQVTEDVATAIAAALSQLDYRVLCVMWGSDQESGAELARSLRNRGVAEMLIDRSEGVDAALEVLRAWMS